MSLTTIFSISILILLISCVKVTSEVISTKRTNSPYISELVFNKKSGFDKYYNLHGNIPIKIRQLDTILSIKIYESLDQEIRLSLPSSWQIQESDRLVFVEIVDCEGCFFTILEHDPSIINIDLKGYLDEVLNQLESDSTNIKDSLRVLSYPALTLDNYHISGNQKEHKKLINFESRIIEFEGKIYDITLSQTENHKSQLNEDIFELIFDSLILQGKSLIPKDMDFKYNLTYDRN